MMPIASLCAFFLVQSVGPSFAFERVATVEPSRSPVPFSSRPTQNQTLLEVVGKTGSAVGSTFARCGVSAQRERDGSVTLEVRTYDGARKGFFQYDRTFSIPPSGYPLRADFRGTQPDVARRVQVASTYDGTVFEGREVAPGAAVPMVAYEIEVDPYLDRVSHVKITEYDGPTKDLGHETASITCAPAGF